MMRNNVAAGASQGYGDFQYCSGCINDHNTVVGVLPNSSGLDFTDQPPTTDTSFVWTNNISPGDSFANACPGGCAFAEMPNPVVGASLFVGGYWFFPGIFGAPNLPAYPPGIIGVSSPVVSDTSSTTPPTTCQNNNADAPWCYPQSWALVGLQDYAGCNAGTNPAGCALAPSSAYKGAGTDGMDIGANIPAILAATSGIMEVSHSVRTIFRPR
jgi:hypothetical protein